MRDVASNCDETIAEFVEQWLNAGRGGNYAGKSREMQGRSQGSCR